MITKTKHAHIESVPGVQGERPVIKGTRTPVRSIVITIEWALHPKKYK